MEMFISGLFILAATYLGYLMGQGKEIRLPKGLRFMARTDAQEAEALRKIEKRALNGGR